METALDPFDKPKVHLGQIVVQHAGGDARLVHAESQDDQVEHQFHVLGHILRKRIGRARNVWSGEGWTPPFEALILRRAIDPFFDIANGFEIFVEFLETAFNGKPNDMPLSDVWKVNEITIAAHEAASTGRPVRVG